MFGGNGGGSDFKVYCFFRRRKNFESFVVLRCGFLWLSDEFLEVRFFRCFFFVLRRFLGGI